MKKFEIERRWILKAKPNVFSWISYIITQAYGVDEIGPYRIRKSIEESSSKITYYLTRKKYVSLGTFEEDETEIPREQFYSCYSKCTDVLKKIRYIYEYKDFKFELDALLSGLILLEVELPKIDTPIEIPMFLKKLIITEITGQSEFSNRNLALPINR